MSSYVSEVRYGLLLALASFVWTCLEYAVGLHSRWIEYHPVVTNLFFPIPILIMWKALAHRRDVLQGGMVTWGQGIASGMVVSVVTGVLGAPSTYIFAKYVNPGFFSTMIEHAVKTRQATQAEAEGYFSLKSYAIQATVFPLVLGLVTALILTAIARRKSKSTPPARANTAA